MDKLLRKPYTFLYRGTGSPMLRQAVNLYGVEELAGMANNPVILGWAEEVAASDNVGAWLADFYTEDSVPWCGLFTAVCAVRAGAQAFNKCLAAREWLHWGDQVEDGDAGLGDVLVFWRGDPAGKSGHVGLYVGESADGEFYHVLGGNQGDEVSIVKIPAYRLLGARRQPGEGGHGQRVIEGGRVTEGEA
jgi:uncharacterized protein (TIGR02594 family)